MKENEISGVYKITNKVTGDFYIGSSKNIKFRWAWHWWPSAWKKQPNFRLYKDMARLGKDNFTFEVLEETVELHIREQYWIDKLKPTYNSYRAYVDINKRKEHNIQLIRDWRQANRDELLAKKRVDCNRLCFYEGETITLNALTSRFRHQGISHARIEAKKYLVEGEN